MRSEQEEDLEKGFEAIGILKPDVEYVFKCMKNEKTPGCGLIAG